MKWIFEGRVYSSLEELKGKTMSEGNKPKPVFTLEELDDCWWESRQTFAMEVKHYSSIHINKFYNNFHDYLEGKFGDILDKLDVGEGAESESEL